MSACRIARAAVALMLTLTLAACGRDADAGRGPPPPVQVVAVPVERGTWADVIEALGTARANESVDVTAKVTETVGKVNFQDGDLVDAGQVLVELTGRAEVAQLEEARAAWKEAQQQYDRQVDLVKQGTIARSQLDAQVALRDAAKARMEAIRARLSDRVITAPFAGVLGFRRVSEGTLVTPGTEIATLDDISTIKVDFSVPEVNLSAIKRGLAVSATSAAYPGRVFKGEVVSIDSRIDPVTRAITVRAAIPNPDAALKPGMLLAVQMASSERDALILPEIAVFGIGSSHFVYAVDQGVARQVEVGIGARREGRVEITTGLSEGQNVVTDGIVKLRDGAKIALKPSVDAAATTAATAPAKG